jgi:leucyl-tRNA synthetase
VNFGNGDADLRRHTHRFLADVPGLIESFKFNVVVARTMEMVNHTRKTVDQGPGGADPAVREATEAIALALSLFAPHTAEDMWERLGHEPSVALSRWPSADHTLLVQESVTAIVQVDGKLRDRLEVSPVIDPDELEALAKEAPGVKRSLEGKTIVKVIVRAPKVVSIQTSS